MKVNVLFGMFLIIFLTACSSSTQSVVSDETTFFGEGEYWKAKYIYNQKLYEEKKVSWVEIEWKELVLSEEDINNIGIELESRDGLITGNVGDMEKTIDGNSISFLVGTVNHEIYKGDEFIITINLKDKRDVFKLQLQPSLFN